MALGFWASRYALLPLRRIGEAAESVALGQLDTRIDYEDYANDVDLAPLVANFNEMVSALQERIDRDARFASDVSHELRSPLTTLNASIEVLVNNRENLPGAVPAGAGPAQPGHAALHAAGRGPARDLPVRRRSGAPRARRRRCWSPRSRPRCGPPRASRIPVESDAALDGVVVSCDKRRLMRILVNFVDNAAKYADGATGVYVERHEPDLDVPDEVLEGPTVRIAVEDEGPGVPEAERTRIFDRFNRGDQGGSRGTDMGVGLGLALAAEHARLQGGRVWVEDRHDGGQGARFVVELPLLADGAPSRRRRPRRPRLGDAARRPSRSR